MNMGTLALAWVLAAGPGAGDTYFINQQQIRIPITVDPARRPEIKEIHLFVSADEGRTWQPQAVASPDQDAFSFIAPRDGVYWFSVAVVNPQNKREPPDPYHAPPSQKIVIDTLKPVLRVKAAERQGDEAVVSWEMQEDYPDLATLKVEYRPAGATGGPWVAVPLTPALCGQARFRPVVPGPLSVRVQVQDLAGNFSTAEGEVSAAANGSTQLAAAPPAAPVSPVAGSFVPPAADVPPAAAPTPVSRTEVRSMPEPAATPAAPAGAGFDAGRLVASSEQPANPVAAGSAAVSPRPVRGALPALLITNNRQLAIDYEVTKVGPSGIGRVELWLTHDDGKSWEKFAETAELKPPLRVELPAEGQYGFRLVLQSRAGRSQPAPVAGTPPELRVELDTTPPTAQLYRPEPDPKQADALILSWSATDRNLAPSPVTLQWAERPGQEWQTIVESHPNDGRYTWKLPPNVPYLVYLRLITHDTAGNSSVAETPEPVCIDLKEPEGRILGISGSVRRAIGAEAARRPGDNPGVALPVSFEKKP
jgi:hypothetical protein